MRRATAALVAAALITSYGSTEDDSPSTNAKELFEGCVSAWDGNHEGLEALIRRQLNDPAA